MIKTSLYKDLYSNQNLTSFHKGIRLLSTTQSLFCLLFIYAQKSKMLIAKTTLIESLGPSSYIYIISPCYVPEKYFKLLSLVWNTFFHVIKNKWWCEKDFFYIISPPFFRSEIFDLVVALNLYRRTPNKTLYVSI